MASRFAVAIVSHGSDVLLDVWVVPGASRSEVVGLHGDAIKVRVAAPAESGRANRAVLDLFEAQFDRPVELAQGRSSRTKRLRICGANQNLVERVLKALLEG